MPAGAFLNLKKELFFEHGGFLNLDGGLEWSWRESQYNGLGVSTQCLDWKNLSLL